MRMDWRSLGYWPIYKDGKLTWEKDDINGGSNTNASKR
jgi:hypothetical protein